HLQMTRRLQDAALPIFHWSPPSMMRPDAKVQKVYLYPKPVDFRKSINGLAALVALDIKVEVFNPVLFVFLNRTRKQVKIIYWERNGFCLWLKRLEAERFKTQPDAGDAAIELTVDELNWLLDGIDLWRNRPHRILPPRLVACAGIIRRHDPRARNPPRRPGSAQADAAVGAGKGGATSGASGPPAPQAVLAKIRAQPRGCRLAAAGHVQRGRRADRTAGGGR